jgi:aspartyl-tRNA(Asn)/glutamyl-tRNA(Gln) amidotransferase subunit B
MEWETVIGLEVHAQLATKSKIFSGSSTAFGAEPNTQASALDLAMPGTLPVPNEQAYRYAIMFGLAIDADIAKTSVFERKNYFYPDLPKAYQTTQLEKPIVGAGHGQVQSRSLGVGLSAKGGAGAGKDFGFGGQLCVDFQADDCFPFHQ